MDVTDAIRTRLDIREFADEPVDAATKRAILDAGRLASSGRNLQHWAFLLVDDPEQIAHLASISTTGSWVGNADFAVLLLTDPQYDFNEIDAGRAVTYMQLAAWEAGVASRIYTQDDESPMAEAFDYPADLTLTLVVGFGYPTRPVESFEGKKDRVSLEAVVHHGTYGTPIDLD